MRVDFKLRLQNRDSQDDMGRHRENLLQAENNRSATFYHSQQIEQNRKISCLCSDFNIQKPKKSRLPIKKKKNVTDNPDVHRTTTRKPLSKKNHDVFQVVSMCASKNFPLNLENSESTHC